MLISSGLLSPKLQFDFGTSGQRSSQSAFGRSTSNDVSGHYKRHYFFLFYFLFSGIYFSHRRSAQIKRITSRTTGARGYEFELF